MADPIISPEARADLSAAWDYLAERNAVAADQFLDDFWVAASRHAAFPRTGRPRDDLRPGLRSFVVGRHVAFFTPDGDTIRIIRVLHGSRDVDRILSEHAGE
jgi:toxin ParE1/3/4